MKFRTVRSANFRTIKQICESYRDVLIEKEIIPKSDLEYYKTSEGLGQILELLMKKLYETEMMNGQLVSTVDAFYHFCRFVVYKDRATGMTVWNSFVKQLFMDVEYHRLVSIMAARGHGKSFTIFVLYQIFKAFLWEGYTSIIVCNIPRMAVTNMRILKEMIGNNELLLEKKEVAKGKELKWTETEIEYNGGYIETISIGTSPKSAHVNMVVGDDVLRDDRKYSDAYNENYFLGQLFPTINRKKGRMCVLGTPVHSEDLLHVLMQDTKGEIIRDGRISAKGFYSKAYPAILDSNKKEILLPEIYSYDQLMKIRDTQGIRYFDREYMCVCISDDSTLFPIELIEYCSDDLERYAFSGKEDSFYVIGVDVATSAAKSADYSAYVVLEVKENKKGGLVKTLRHVFHDKGIQVDTQIEKIAELSKLFNNAFVLVEKNNVGVALIQGLEKGGINIKSYVTDAPKKIGCVRYLINEMRNRRVIFPKENEYIKRVKDELKNFGVLKKGTREVMTALSGHDDLVDALWLALEASRQMESPCSLVICQD